MGSGQHRQLEQLLRRPRRRRPGPGRIVTATFAISSSDLRLIKLKGSDTQLDVTGNHPIFCKDYNDFIAAAKLKAGDCLRTRSGVAIVEYVAERPGTWNVHNLEIGESHVYYVTEQDVLVHNTQCADLDVEMDGGGGFNESGGGGDSGGDGDSGGGGRIFGQDGYDDDFDDVIRRNKQAIFFEALEQLANFKTAQAAGDIAGAVEAFENYNDLEAALAGLERIAPD